MKILCKSAYKGGMEASQQVNKIGKYLAKQIDGAKYRIDGNNHNFVTFPVYYQIPASNDERYQRVDDEVHEMTVVLDITTYQNKIRINTIAMTPEETTLGFNVLKPEELIDLPKAQEKIMRIVEGRLGKAFEDYDFVF